MVPTGFAPFPLQFPEPLLKTAYIQLQGMCRRLSQARTHMWHTCIQRVKQKDLKTPGGGGVIPLLQPLLKPLREVCRRSSIPVASQITIKEWTWARKTHWRGLCWVCGVGMFCRAQWRSLGHLTPPIFNSAWQFQSLSLSELVCQKTVYLCVSYWFWYSWEPRPIQ